MTSTLVWTLIAVQIAMGAFDTLFHHELTERLPWRTTQRRELLLHGARNLLYAFLFVTLGWFEADGLFAVVAMAVLGAELVITLMDFVEEDMSRKLPASERINHTLLALNYGAILVLIVPVLLGWAHKGTGWNSANHGWWSVLASLAAIAVVVFGARDLAASLRTKRLMLKPAGALATALPRHRTILVTGATGFVGCRLVEALVAQDHSVIVLTRDPKKALALPPPFQLVTDLDQIAPDTRIDAVVHLAGESISGGLWTEARKRAVIQSRVTLIRAIERLVARLAHRPAVFVNASAVGWYGLRDDEPLTEYGDSRPCFSHESCAACEAAALELAEFGIRVINLRIGLVLGTEGGLLARLLAPFEFGLGGPIGAGKQWMSWIARDDLVRLIVHVIATPSLSGPVNATAPGPVQNREFARELGHALHRPALLPLPATPLRLLGGEFAKELLLGGQRVLPHKALGSGFAFRHPDLRGALHAILGTKVAHRPARHAHIAERLELS
ncbi:MAG TPA: TIGR01777 family oxidoreductase [Rhizomicrobium sp.]|nr:TIGR01777 family oxidoreductase [Rhizomicrobium sp.]